MGASVGITMNPRQCGAAICTSLLRNCYFDMCDIHEREANCAASHRTHPPFSSTWSVFLLELTFLISLLPPFRNFHA